MAVEEEEDWRISIFMVMLVLGFRKSEKLRVRGY